MTSPIDLSGKTILLTGASKGIGAATAAILGASGAYLVAHYGSDRAGAEAATAAIPEERKLLLGADLADLDAVEAMWAAALAWRGRIDVLVNNAAIMPFDGGFDAPLADFDRAWADALAINVMAPARMMRAAVNHFLESGGGSIVTISSWAAQRGVTNPATIAYGASKAAVKSATQSIARAYAKDNIQAYVVAPGVVRTRLSEQFAATQGGEEKISATLATGEWVTPDELGRLVAFLASGATPQLSGSTLDVNGASYVR
ncbi:epimerase [Polymorphobacter multimanifer]|uniref:NAD(P)-dependent dehydrogenase (Short-subunit alcohol dehydrogenase family) n=1 Tax=Polymorphobacter multimanifer TaxID=1070431 RepID=A0A841LF45_9SPHN|nr:SDR family oxidoreductase [Polymorphobacter multimanifer]MBB6227782.1 NAD(P)-dependent dehydrogenase (short-subunit alcohol dehydrogenase family) [Polymorphobacter multimanifer]GGI76975.1 epimerase [Polymorphobacter multimanifer]